jgi:ribosome biogenesis GTPase
MPEPRGARADTSPQQLQHGLVVSAHGRHVVVLDAAGGRQRCHLRGRRMDAVVGDAVEWAPSGDEGVIERIRPRRNEFFRQDAWRTKHFAANLDALLVLVAVEPSWSDAVLVRALVAAASAGIPAWIGLNKTDLAAAPAARQRLAACAAMGVEIVELSLKAQPGASETALRERLRGRTTLVLGPSGTGKSTLVNLLAPGAAAAVGEISRALQSGRHTTTATTWYPLGSAAGEGALVDSPGFQEFGLHHVAAADLAGLMPDLAAHLGACRFLDCTHRQEPGCAVRAAAEAGEIDATRWRLYGSLYEELALPGRR